VSFEFDDVTEDSYVHDISRYESLGMLANPFVSNIGSEEAVDYEIGAAGNQFLGAILERSRQEAPKPVFVHKPDLSHYFSLTAIGQAEQSLATDDSLNVLYAYVQLFMMKVGMVRATLNVLAERLVFRDFDTTLGCYLAKVLAEPDESLASYGVLGPERLQAFAARFEQDRAAAVAEVFGAEELERRPELAQVGDVRHLNMDASNVEPEEIEEIDSTVGDAPGTPVLLAEAAEHVDEDTVALLDYFIEYTREHLSPVLARGLRVYRDRGLVAFSEELKVTKAPRKTIVKLIEFASVRFSKVVLIFDAFENWREIDSDLRSQLIGAYSELRWKTAGGAFIVFMVQPGEAPELEETFGGSDVIAWDFPGVVALQDNPGVILPEVINGWLAAATRLGATPITIDDPVLTTLVQEADGSMFRFIATAAVAIDSAADRGVAALDDRALEDARRAAEAQEVG
jgi:hypothetical protein